MVPLEQRRCCAYCHRCHISCMACRSSWLPQWHLQGLHERGRAAIITASMRSLQQVLRTAPTALAAAPAAVLEAAAVAAVAAAACDACAASIGYVPPELLRATVGALQALREELDSFEAAAEAPPAAGAPSPTRLPPASHCRRPPSLLRERHSGWCICHGQAAQMVHTFRQCIAHMRVQIFLMPAVPIG